MDVSNDLARRDDAEWLSAPPADPRFWTEEELAVRERVRSVYPMATEEQIWNLLDRV